MEIYKLSDEVPSEKNRVDSCGSNSRGARTTSDDSSLLITELKSGVKNPNRVNVYVNHKYAFSLDVAQVVDLGVKVGRELNNAELEEMKRASEFGKLYQRALEWVLVRPRSERELRDYLYRKLHKASSGTTSRQPVFTGGARLHSRPSQVVHRASPQNEKQVSRLFGSYDGRQQPPKDPSEALLELSDEVINRLIARGYVDDRRFAEFWVENRFVKKGVSRKRLSMELMKKGVKREIIDEVLDGRNDEEEILKMIAKKRAKYDDEKLIAYLCRQGFPYQLVQTLVRDYEKD